MKAPYLLAVLAAAAAVSACSDDAVTPIDAPDAVDAAVDAIDAGGRCGADFFLTGEYVDWDSTSVVGFDGIEFATWTVRGEPTRTVMTNPNGRVELCLAPGAVSTISIDQGSQNAYLPGIYVADPQVFQAPGLFFFSTKNLKHTRATTFYANDLALTFDAQRAHLLVQKQGAPIALTSSRGGTAFAVDNGDDLTWTAGSSGGLVLFANIDISGGATTTLGSTTAFVGPTTLPLEAGTLTITTIR